MRDHHLIAGNFLTVGKLVGKKMRRKAHFYWVAGGGGVRSFLVSCWIRQHQMN
jgi:hypothetical protein